MVFSFLWSQHSFTPTKPYGFPQTNTASYGQALSHNPEYSGIALLWLLVL